MNPFKQILALLLLSGITFFISNFLLNGSLSKTNNLSGELKSPPDSLYLWKIANESPFKYRLLHKAIVNSTYQLIEKSGDNNELFFSTYRVFSFLFHALAILIFYYFLSQIGLKELAFTGATLFACLPAMLLAYNVPVHTREDTLAYCLLQFGLVAIIKNRTAGIFIFSLLGVVCRETLLIMPFVNLFFNAKQKLITRLIVAGLCFLVFAGIRLYLGTESYNHWEGFNWNRTHLEQVIAFSFITFGVLWIPFLLSLVIGRNEKSILYRSAPYAFGLILTTTFMGGIFNEIRILYLIAPWVISIAMFYMKENSNTIINYVSKKSFQKFSIALGIAMVVGGYFITTSIDKFISPSQYDIPYRAWVIVGLVQLYITIVCLPYFFNKKEV